MSGRPFRSLNAWPSLPNFRETLLGYYDACATLGVRLHRAFACDLGLEPGFFDDKFDRPMATLRLLHYPAPPQGSEPQTGAGAHTDYGNLTLLATDDVGGLEVRARDGLWIEAPVVPGAFIVNIGDCLMRWTNGHLRLDFPSCRQPERQGAVFDRFFLRPRSGRARRDISVLRAPRRARPLSADPRRGLLKQRLDASKPAEAARPG